MIKTTAIAFASALALFAGSAALAGNGASPKAGGPQGGVQPTTAEGAATKSGDAAAVGGASSGAMKRGQSTTSPEPSSKGGK